MSRIAPVPTLGGVHLPRTWPMSPGKKKSGGGSYSSVVLADNPVLLYPLDDASGTAARDLSGNGHAGLYNNAPTLNVASIMPGVTGTAATFNGSTQYISCPTLPTITTAFSVEAWLKFVSFTAFACIMSTRGPSDYSFDERVDTSANHLNCDMGDGSAWDAIPFNATFTWALNTLYHVLWVVSGTTWTAYVNGTSIGTGSSINGTLLFCDASHLATWFQGGRGGPGPSYVNATAQMLAVYNTALSAARVAAHYNAGIA